MTMHVPELSEADLRLRLLDPDTDAETALPWYSDPEVLAFSEDGATAYDLPTIKRMYRQLAAQGELYVVEVQTGDRWLPVGDAALLPDDLPIVIGGPEHRSRGVGGRVLDLLIRRAEGLGWSALQAKRVLAENQRARRLFLSRGFWIDGVETADSGRRYYRFRLGIGHPRNPWEYGPFVRRHSLPSLARAQQRAREEAAWLVEALGARPGQRLLDLGCGSGRHALELARCGFHVVGVDISNELLAEAADRARKEGLAEIVCFVHGNMRYIGYTEEFDHAYCLFESGWGTMGDDLAHLDFLRRVRRALRPGGRLALASRNLYRWVARGNPKLDLLTARLPWKFSSEVDEPGGHYELGQMIRGFSPAEVSLMSRLAGLKPLSFHGVALETRQLRADVGVDDVEHIGVLEAMPETAWSVVDAGRG
jgi:SAM-dependent methyltransferase